MIYVTGDTHREHDFAKLEFFAKRNPQLTKNDYVIIAGDFGGVWWRKTLSEDLKPYENFPAEVALGVHQGVEQGPVAPAQADHGVVDGRVPVGV